MSAISSASARAMVDLPDPDRPVKKTTAPVAVVALGRPEDRFGRGRRVARPDLPLDRPWDVGQPGRDRRTAKVAEEHGLGRAVRGEHVRQGRSAGAAPAVVRPRDDERHDPRRRLRAERRGQLHGRPGQPGPRDAAGSGVTAGNRHDQQHRDRRDTRDRGPNGSFVVVRRRDVDDDREDASIVPGELGADRRGRPAQVGVPVRPAATRRRPQRRQASCRRDPPPHVPSGVFSASVRTSVSPAGDAEPGSTASTASAPPSASSRRSRPSSSSASRGTPANASRPAGSGRHATGASIRGLSAPPPIPVRPTMMPTSRPPTISGSSSVIEPWTRPDARAMCQTCVDDTFGIPDRWRYRTMTRAE